MKEKIIEYLRSETQLIKMSGKGQIMDTDTEIQYMSVATYAESLANAHTLEVLRAEYRHLNGQREELYCMFTDMKWKEDRERLSGKIEGISLALENIRQRMKELKNGIIGPTIDLVDFAKWVRIEGWIDSMDGWFCPPGKERLTDTQLLELYENREKKEGI